ncbi:hypothetical protein FE236_02950 [Mariprofundus erugo]|uniref:hypothetical protein n=1 Tax=Mariprofundus erugo TaxID=2528639 RepID=UPI0010FD4CFA|nr:hypothetical protein [Mariprofundus erugo]TLS77580.1 hypothetical protein FE236_02950 [Mariprofundus erugo]
MRANKYEIKELVDREYQKLECNLGWSMLYCPFENMWSPRYPIAFFGLNPAGNEYFEPSISYEKGSAYLCDEWGYKAGEAPLQKQVVELFKSIASSLHSPVPYADLLKGSFAANFVPFRSKDWGCFERKIEALEFSRALWRERVNVVPTNLYITMAKISFSEIASLLIAVGYHELENTTDKVGWGNVTYQMNAYEREGHKSLLIRLPHLSRYKIFGREESQMAINHISSVAAEYVTQRN